MSAFFTVLSHCMSCCLDGNLSLLRPSPTRFASSEPAGTCMNSGIPTILLNFRVLAAVESENTVAIMRLKPNLRTAGCAKAIFGIAGSINVNERTALGFIAAAASATQAPKECPTK